MLDAGDSMTGDRKPSYSTQGQTGVEVMNLMAYDALALGQQDLGLGPELVQERMAEARFPLLSANVVLAGTDQLLTEPYLIRRVGDLRVGIVGLTGVTKLAGVEIRDPVQTAAQVVPEVAAQADLVILLSHTTLQDERRIADTVPGIAFILGGTREPLAQPETRASGTVILHADQPSPGHAGRYLGILRVALDAQGQVVAHHWTKFALGAGITDDPDMAAWVAANRNR